MIAAAQLAAHHELVIFAVSASARQFTTVILFLFTILLYSVSLISACLKMERKWSTPLDPFEAAAGADEQKPVLCQSEHAMEEAVGFR